MEHIDLQPGFVFSPQPMYMIGTNNEDGTPNFCIITWIGFSADNGPCLMMTIGGTKLTKTNILREKRFSANMITEDTLWLADYFGTTRGEDRAKNVLPYTVLRGKMVDVPLIGESHWIYECEVIRHIPLGGAVRCRGAVRNIRIERAFREMDMDRIVLTRIRPAVYSPYRYYSVGELLGEMGEWKTRCGVSEAVSSLPEKADGMSFSPAPSGDAPAEDFRVRRMQPSDARIFTEEEIAQGWYTDISKFEGRLRDQEAGKCISLVAEYRGRPAGYVHVYLRSTEGPYAGTDLPVIVDFAVLEKYRRMGIGRRLMDEAERIAGRYADAVCLAVGLHSGYGSAQRMYVKRGYIPDGTGIWYNGKPCIPYETICTADDDMTLFMMKKLHS